MPIRYLLELSRALASLLSSGLSITRALSAAKQVLPEEMAGCISSVCSRVERGESLAAALGAYPEQFPALYVGVVRAGERSGDLAGAFRRLATQLERDEEIRSKILSASIYPLILAVTGFVATVVLLMFVVPRFADLMGPGAELPALMRFLLGVSGVFTEHWVYMVWTLVAALGGIVWMIHSERGCEALSRATLRIPVIGTLRRDSIAARFARLCGVLLSGGAPLLSALHDTEQSMVDPTAVAAVAHIRNRVREGMGLAQSIAECSDLFPSLLVQLVAVGEESGKLQEFLLHAAGVFEQRTERSLQRLTSLMEPVMILLFGGIVGLVALSLLQTIYGINAGSFR